MKKYGVYAIIVMVMYPLLVLVYGMFLTAFTYRPEHVTELRGETLVAEVNSFLDVKAAYYDYNGIFFRDTVERGHEWYGSGGYDPFKGNTKPEPRSYTYYDENGKIAEQGVN